MDILDGTDGHDASLREHAVQNGDLSPQAMMHITAELHRSCAEGKLADVRMALSQSLDGLESLGWFGFASPRIAADSKHAQMLRQAVRRLSWLSETTTPTSSASSFQLVPLSLLPVSPLTLCSSRFSTLSPCMDSHPNFWVSLCLCLPTFIHTKTSSQSLVKMGKELCTCPFHTSQLERTLSRTPRPTFPRPTSRK